MSVYVFGGTIARAKLKFANKNVFLTHEVKTRVRVNQNVY
jgi:hypothetical protein